jgi:hypothetical protein
VGFFDGEGTLYIDTYEEETKTTKVYNMTALVKLSIHVDDGLVLYNIRDKLKVGSITTSSEGRQIH